MTSPTRLSITAMALALSGCLHSEAASSDAPLAAVSGGTLRGVAEDGLKIFKGIPFAAPPIGALRWKAPRPAAKWSGIRDATAFGPDCIQPPVPATSIYNDPPEKTSEDCLTLNVWAPENANDAPVIVWLHGGSLRIGGSSLRLYDGRKYSERGAVFVSVNYRLGPLGWLAHSELSDESSEGISGNYGLLDQIAALGWVRDNIEAFGGNSQNVTIMGESAGALSVTYLMASPRASNLFDKAIIQSTNLRTFPRLDEPAHGLPSMEEIGALTLGRLGVASISEARGHDAQDLTNRAIQAGFPAQGTIDGKVLPRQLVETFDRNEQAPVPVLVGFNSHEVSTQRVLLPPMAESAQAYEAAIRRAYGDLADEYLRLYPAIGGDESLVDAASHGIYGWSGERIAKSQTEMGKDAYFFVFDYCYPAAQVRGICGFHAGELPFSFGNLGAGSLPATWPVPDGLGDEALSRAILDYWVSFATTGKPAAAGHAEWYAYGIEENYLKFADSPESSNDPYQGMFELHEKFNKRQREAGQPWGIAIGLAADPDTKK